MSGKIIFFKGQGIVSEFYDLTGKNEIFGNAREFYISTDEEAWVFGLMYFSCLIYEIFDSNIVKEI